MAFGDGTVGMGRWQGSALTECQAGACVSLYLSTQVGLHSGKRGPCHRPDG
jgi:hypothetical protein